MEITDDLINKGEYSEALERTIWFHNHSLEHDISMYGVRLSFALSDWYDFGKKYPPALKALKDIRDKKTKLIASGDGSFNLFMDVSSINGVLSEDNKTITLFKAIEAKQPELAKQSWDVIKDAAIEQKDYSLINRYIKDLMSVYSQRERDLQSTTDVYKNYEKSDAEQLIKMSEDSFVEDTIKLIDLAVSLNDIKTAKLIKRKASQRVNDNRINSVTIK